MDKYASLDPSVSWTCGTCATQVLPEFIVLKDQRGKDVKLYTPASRYWNDKAVYCSPECSQAFPRVS